MKQLTHYFLVLFVVFSLTACGGGDNGVEGLGEPFSTLDFVVSKPKEYFEFRETEFGQNLLVLDLTDSTIQSYMDMGCLFVSIRSMRYVKGDEAQSGKSFRVNNEQGEVYSEEQYFGTRDENAEFTIPRSSEAVTANATLDFSEDCNTDIGSTEIANDRVDM